MKTTQFIFSLIFTISAVAEQSKGDWKKHVIWEGQRNNVAVAADFTGDGKVDVISSSSGKTRLFVAPDWRQTIIGDNKDHTFIHGETFDVDGDGDADFIGARYKPGLIVWFEQPKAAAAGPWKARIAEDEIIGIHGVLKADVNGDGKLDLLANSGQPKGKFPNSAAWLEVPKNPRNAKRWTRHIFAKEDAPGLSHYLGAGDLNGDGLLNVVDIILLVNYILNSLPVDCYIEPEVGPCDGICPTYYYNQNTNQCEEFITGCCGVEAFDSMQNCIEACQ